MCQTFQTLPASGGVLDQDCYLMIGMSLVLNAQHKRAELDRERERERHGMPRGIRPGGRNAFRR